MKTTETSANREKSLDPLKVIRLKPVGLKAKTRGGEGEMGQKIRFASLPLKRLQGTNATNTSREKDTVESKQKQYQIKRANLQTSSVANGRVVKFQLKANAKLLQNISRQTKGVIGNKKENSKKDLTLGNSMVENQPLASSISMASVPINQLYSMPLSSVSMSSVTQMQSRPVAMKPKKRKPSTKKKTARIKTADKIPAPANVAYFFKVKKGNNHEMIERIISNRSWWRKEVPLKVQASTKVACNVQFQWWMVNRGLNFFPSRVMNESYLTKKSCNRFSHAFELSDKDNLLRNIWHFGQRTKIDIFKSIPLTFSFRMQEGHFLPDLQEFARFYQSLEKGVDLASIEPIRNHQSEALQREIPIYFNFDFKFPASLKEDRKYSNPDCSTVARPREFFNGKNLWILKPSGCDRGKGVEIFRSLDELNRYLTMYASGYNMSEYTKMNYGDDDVVSPSMKEGGMVDGVAKRMTITKFVIQKYMERPALFKGYKFDIRAHAMLTQDKGLYVFRNSFVRICSLPYEIDKNNYFAHLCNTSVNMKSNNFGNLVVGNQMSIIELAKFFDEKEANNPSNTIKEFEPYLFEQITRLVKFAFDACLTRKNLLNPQEVPNTFELFGFDVMVDEAYNCWLIEANYVPGLTDEDSPYLKAYLDRMMDDLFKLTLDDMYPMPKNGTRKVSQYPFLHYPNNENLWKLVCQY